MQYIVAKCIAYVLRMYRNVFGVASVLVMYYICIVVYSQCIRRRVCITSVSVIYYVCIEMYLKARRYLLRITYVLQCIWRRIHDTHLIHS